MPLQIKGADDSGKADMESRSLFNCVDGEQQAVYILYGAGESLNNGLNALSVTS